MAGQNQNSSAQQRELYVSWCARRLKGALDEAEKRRVQSERDLGQAAIKLLNDIREHHRAAQELADLREQRKRRLEEAGQNFDRLTSLPTVARIQPMEYGWCVVTTPLAVKIGGRRYELGKFEIHLAFDGRVKILNQSRRLAYRQSPWDHPSVCDGEPLFPPERAVSVVRCIAARRWAEAAESILVFLTEEGLKRGLAPLKLWPSTVEEAKKDGRQIRRRLE